MGIVYYSRYYEFFEAARTDMLRDLGLPYGDFEKSGYTMPVTESRCKYHNSAKFDQLLTIKCLIREKPKARLKINYIVKNESERLIAKGYTVHAFLDNKGLIRRAPDKFLELFQS